MASPAPTETQLRAALAHYPELEHCEVQPLGEGLINHTFALGSDHVLQRLNTEIFSPRIHENILAVTEHLRAKGQLSPRLCITSGGLPYAQQSDGSVWRVMSRVAGSSYSRVSGPSQAHSASALVAKWHRALGDLQHTFVELRSVHDTPRHLENLRTALAEHASHRLYERVRPLGEAILEQAETMEALPITPPLVIHGDLKFNNLLFEGDEARALIDLDTVGTGPLAFELGDAWRSWCNPKGEDQGDSEFDLEIFEASIDGYFSAAPWPDANQRKSLLLGVEQISLELAARFAADALQESYFGWNPQYKSAGDHNLLRAQGQFTLYQSALSKRSQREKLLRLS